MLKNTILLFFLFFGWTHASIGQIVYNENFNAGLPNNWQVVDQDGWPVNAAVAFVTNAWVTNPDPDSLGVKDSCMVSTSWYTAPQQSNDWLISPKYFFSQQNVLHWQSISFDVNYKETYEVYCSETNDVAQINSSDLIATISNEDTAWTLHSVNLAEYGYINKSGYIAFKNISNDRFLLGIDNVYVRQEPLHVANSKLGEALLRVYPNPTSSVLNLQNIPKKSTVKIYNHLGQLVQSQQLYGTQIILVNNLPSGSYVLQVSSETTVQSARFQKL